MNPSDRKVIAWSLITFGAIGAVALTAFLVATMVYGKFPALSPWDAPTDPEQPRPPSITILLVFTVGSMVAAMYAGYRGLKMLKSDKNAPAVADRGVKR